MKLYEGTMPSKITVLDWDKELLCSDDWSIVNSVLTNLPKIASLPNAIVDIIHPNAGRLSIGVAGAGDADNSPLEAPAACINHMPASGNPPYLSIVRSASEPEDSSKILVFRYEGGTWTEIPMRNSVPTASMLNIARHFCYCGSLADWCEWEEV